MLSDDAIDFQEEEEDEARKLSDKPLWSDADMFVGKPQPAPAPAEWRERIYENQRKAQITSGVKECKHCTRQVTSLFGGNIGCTYECSLGLAAFQPHMYNYIHAMITKEGHDVLPAPRRHASESSAVYWKRVLETLYPECDRRRISLQEQLKRNNIQSFEQSKSQRQ
jgi:hypothetical protein